MILREQTKKEPLSRGCITVEVIVGKEGMSEGGKKEVDGSC
jgi:hypothetical protein